MEIPRWFHIEDGNTKRYFLKLHRNIYGQKKAWQEWYISLTKTLVNKEGFKQSKLEKCIFYRRNVIYVVYIDDSILAGPKPKDIAQSIKYIKAA